MKQMVTIEQMMIFTVWNRRRVYYNEFLDIYTETEDEMRTAIEKFTSSSLYREIKMIDNYNIDTDRLGVYGRSMGGRVAMMLANENVGEFASSSYPKDVIWVFGSIS